MRAISASRIRQTRADDWPRLERGCQPIVLASAARLGNRSRRARPARTDMTVSISTDSVRPTERQAYWTEAICRSFANVETRPLGASVVSGHFEFFEIGDAKLVRFDSSPQCYRRDSRLVSAAGSDDFMFDFQTRGRSWMTQGTKEGAIEPGFGVLYDARRPFEDRLDGPGQRAEVLIATMPAASLSATFANAERSCAMPVPLSGVVSCSIARLVRSLLRPAEDRGDANPDRTTLSPTSVRSCARARECRINSTARNCTRLSTSTCGRSSRRVTCLTRLRRDSEFPSAPFIESFPTEAPHSRGTFCAGASNVFAHCCRSAACLGPRSRSWHWSAGLLTRHMLRERSSPLLNKRHEITASTQCSRAVARRDSSNLPPRCVCR